MKAKTLVSVCVAAACSLMIGYAAEQTLTGKISDSMCGASHTAMEHGGKKVNDRECTLACVKGGQKYVFVSDSKVYNIENQDYSGLKQHAGHTVKLIGDISADGNSIKVSNIQMPARGKGKKKESKG